MELNTVYLIFEIQPMDLKKYITNMPAGTWMDQTLVKAYCKQVICQVISLFYQ
jgi:hypothetical protein